MFEKVQHFRKGLPENKKQVLRNVWSKYKNVKLHKYTQDLFYVLCIKYRVDSRNLVINV